MARAQVIAVSDNGTANGPIRRQLPSRCSKTHDRYSGSRVIQSSTKASTSGRTGSIGSQAKLSRAKGYPRGRTPGEDQAQARQRLSGFSFPLAASTHSFRFSLGNLLELARILFAHHAQGQRNR